MPTESPLSVRYIRGENEIDIADDQKNASGSDNLVRILFNEDTGKAEFSAP
jgi:hypothetical protein